MLPDIERDECRSCGQQVLGERDASGAFRCFHCLEASRASQGSQERLFEPARAQMEGQGFWALDVEPLPRRVLP
jgi:ribosomal protein L37AE/L43A